MAAVCPLRSYAKEGKSLGDVIAASAHGGSTPHRKPDCARVVAVVLHIAFQHQRSGLETQRPACLCGNGARVYRIEVASGRQHVGTAARGRAARPGRHEAPRQPARKLQQLLFATGQQPWAQVALDTCQHGAGSGPVVARRQAGFKHLQGEQFEAFTGVTQIAPATFAERGKDGRPCALPRQAPVGCQRVEVRAQLQVGGECVHHAGLAAAAIADRVARKREQGIALQTTLW